MNTHTENISEYLELGGDEKRIRHHVAPSLQNRAHVLHLLKELRKNATSLISKITAPTEKVVQYTEQPKAKAQTIESTPSHKLLGFISQYPSELHAVYQKAFNYWLTACSLKVKLNEIPADNEADAYDLQKEIYDCMKGFDQAKKALDYYNTEKSILPTENKKDLSALSPLELDRRLRNLRPLITRRKQTLANLLAKLPANDDPKYRARLSAYNKKREELEIYELEAREIEGLLK